MSSKQDSDLLNKVLLVNKLDLKPEDFELHEKLIRHLKGMVSAYESWLKAKKLNQS